MTDQKPHFRPLDAAEEQELDHFMTMGIEMLPVHPDIQQDGALVIAIHLVLDACRQGQGMPSGIDKETLLLCLGVVWGEELCRIAGWSWSYCQLANGLEGPIVVDEHCRRFCFPINCLAQWWEDKSEPESWLRFFTQLCMNPTPTLENNAMQLMVT